MIIATERCGKEDSHWFLIAAHVSDLYRRSTWSPDLISLFESASLREDYLVGWSGSFFSNLSNLFRDWRRTSGGDEDKKKYGEETLFSLPKCLGTNLRILGFSHPKKRGLSSFSHTMKSCPNHLTMKILFRYLSIMHKRKKSFHFGIKMVRVWRVQERLDSRSCCRSLSQNPHQNKATPHPPFFLMIN